MCIASLSAAQTPPKTPPLMRAHALTEAPVLDGDVLGDAAWRGAESATGFWQRQPDEGHPATQETEVFMGFSDDALYIGLVAYDDDPDGIIVSDSRRDSSLDDTDSFQVILDGLLDRQNGFLFGTNPAGIEYDGQVVREGTGGVFGGGGFNLNWDGTWDVVAAISDIGWSAEMRIPFRTLRYGSGDEQVWGVNFQRNIRRNNEVAFWSPLDRQRTIYRISEAGTVTGLVPPSQRNLKFTPYVLGSRAEGGDLVGTETDTEFGFDLKYSITPALTLDATYNTDFAQVEVDEVVINLDRFNIFLPEKRPFFLENAGQFTVGNSEEVEIFFSRRIGIGEEGAPIPIDGGVRLSGKIGGTTNVGFLHMSSEPVAGDAPGNKYTVARVNQELRNRSAIGAIIINRKGDGSHLVSAENDENQTYALDGRWGIGENLLLQAWLAKTDTPTLAGKDDAFSLKGDYDSAKWSFRAEYTEVGGDFNPEVGFLARSDYRKVSGLILRRIRPDDLWGLLELRPHISYRGFWDFDGFQETGFLHVDNHWEFRSGYEIHTGVNFTREGVKEPFDIIDGVTIQPGTYDHAEGQIVFNTDLSAPLSLSLRTTVGGRFGGDRVSISPTIRYRIGETFSTELAYDYNDFDLPVPNGQFNANLSRLRLSYSFTPKILVQVLAQYNEVDDIFGTNFRFSWLRSANTGLYLVYNEVDERGVDAVPTGRELILKYSHIFDVFN